VIAISSRIEHLFDHVKQLGEPVDRQVEGCGRRR